jgi:hypothetical protein
MGESETADTERLIREGLGHVGVGEVAEAGFVLSLADGETTVEQLIALSGLDAFEALRILNHLIDAGIAGLQS